MEEKTKRKKATNAYCFPKKDPADIFVRMNSRITKAQKKFIKQEAKRLKIKEGELHRQMIDFYIESKSVELIGL